MESPPPGGIVDVVVEVSAVVVVGSIVVVLNVVVVTGGCVEVVERWSSWAVESSL